MTLGRLLTELSRQGIQLETDGERLRFHPKSAMTPELIEQLQTHKPQILHYFQTGEIRLEAQTATVGEVRDALEFFRKNSQSKLS